MSGKLRELTNADFAEAVSTGTVLVDLWAPWCGPCRAQTPILEALADEVAGKVTICKLNIDENAEPAVQYGVTAIPTLLLFKDGKLAKTFVGLQQASSLKAAF